MEEERARELVDRYGDLLVRLGYAWLGDLDDAQDVCQTVLLKLLEDPRIFPDQGQERAWVIRLGINVCKDWRKSAWYRRRAPLEAAAAVAAPAAAGAALDSRGGGDLPNDGHGGGGGAGLAYPAGSGIRRRRRLRPEQRHHWQERGTERLDPDPHRLRGR